MLPSRVTGDDHYDRIFSKFFLKSTRYPAVSSSNQSYCLSRAIGRLRLGVSEHGCLPVFLCPQVFNFCSDYTARLIVSLELLASPQDVFSNGS